MIKFLFVIVNCFIVILSGCTLHSDKKQLTITNSEVIMEWKVLNGEAVLQEIIQQSATKPQVIFKHSTRCSISSVAKSRLDKAQTPSDVDFYYLDLIRYRDLSNKIAEIFEVEHESPQVLVIKKGKSVYHESHMGISIDEIMEHANTP